MTVTADQVVVELIADVDNADVKIREYRRTFDRSMVQIEGSASRMERKTKAAFSGVKAAVGSAAAGLIAAVGIGTLLKLGKDALDYAASLGEVSQQLGVTTTDLQVYRFAATQVGVSQEEMDQGLAKLSKSLGEAALGAKQDIKVFDALGISIKNADGSIKTAGQVIPEIADALNQIPDPAKRAAVEIQIFGRAGQKLDTLLAGGSKAIDELRAEAVKLGIVLSNEQIQKADQTADKIAKLQFQLKQNIAGTVADNAAAIESLVSGLASLVSWLGQAVTGFNNFRTAHNRAVMQRLATDAPSGSPLARMAQRALDAERSTLRQGGLDSARLLNMSGEKPAAAPRSTVDQNALNNVLAPEARASSKGGKSDLEKSYDALAHTLNDTAADIRSMDAASFMSALGLKSSQEISIAELPTVRDSVDAIEEEKNLRFKATQAVEDDRLAKSEDTVRTVASLYEDAMIGGTKRIGDTLKSALISAIAQALATQMFGSEGMKSGGFFGNVLGGVTSALGFGGFRASGGPVSAGKSYVVGERGPELLHMKQPGFVTPNRAAVRGGSTTVIQHITVDGRNSVTPEEFAREIIAHANRQAAAMDANLAKGMDAAAPGRLSRYQVLGT